MSVRRISSSLKEENLKILKVSCKIRVLSSMDSPSSLPNRPPPLSINMIEKITNMAYLKKLEKNYDEFVDKNSQILMLYNVIEDYLEIRDALTIRISKLKRENNLRFYNYRYYLES